MTNLLLRPLFSGLLLLVFYSAATAQEQTFSQDNNRNIVIVGAKKTVAVTGKVAYVIVKETANLGWEATKLTTKEVAAPVAKKVFLKALPKIIKRATPIATKAAITYLKL